MGKRERSWEEVAPFEGAGLKSWTDTDMLNTKLLRMSAMLFWERKEEDILLVIFGIERWMVRCVDSDVCEWGGMSGVGEWGGRVGWESGGGMSGVGEWGGRVEWESGMIEWGGRVGVG